MTIICIHQHTSQGHCADAKVGVRGVVSHLLTTFQSLSDKFPVKIVEI